MVLGSPKARVFQFSLPDSRCRYDFVGGCGLGESAVWEGAGIHDFKPWTLEERIALRRTPKNFALRGQLS